MDLGELITRAERSSEEWQAYEVTVALPNGEFLVAQNVTFDETNGRLELRADWGPRMVRTPNR